MTLEEVRVQIDDVDTQMKPLFLKRMECAKHVAEAKAVTGADVFVPERERLIIEQRASDVVPGIREEYVNFLHQIMSISRRYQYGFLSDMQNQVLSEALHAAELDGNAAHSQVQITFCCEKISSDLNLFINMIKLNKITIDSMEMYTADGRQQITMVLDGSLKDSNMRRLLCQIGKEAEDFAVAALR